MTAIHRKLHEQIDLLPEAVANQVLDFLKLVKTRKSGNDSSNNEARPPAPYKSWIEYRMNNPHQVSPDWKPMTRDEAHDRKLC